MIIKSRLLGTAAKLLSPLIFLFSVYLLFRGHNEAGGGFLGGLVAASAFTLLIFAQENNKKSIINTLLLKRDPGIVAVLGLVCATLAPTLGLLLSGELFYAIWISKLINTPMLFDVGVYFVVFGSVSHIVYTISSE